MTTRYRIRLASLAVGCTLLIAMSTPVGAFELFGHVMGKGSTSYGCGASDCATCSAKGGGKSAKSCGCCAGTPVLDRVAEMTRNVKCRLASIELPKLRMPCIDLSSLLPCNKCCSCDSCSSGKGAGKYSSGGTYMSAPSLDTPSHSDAPVHAPPVPIVNP